MPNAKVIFKFGTRAEYDALDQKLDNALYFLTDTNELYRGTVPFNTPHIFKGLYGDAENLAEALDTIVGDAPIINGDFAIVVNADNSQDAYIWSADNEEWIHLGNTNTSSLSQRVISLEAAIADLDSILNGDPEDPEADDGLLDRVAVLEAVIANQQGGPIPIFNGTISGLVPVPENMTDNQKAKHFLNGMGRWVEISGGGEGGQNTYVTPDGNTFYTAEEYVEYMIEHYGHEEWQSIDG